jgi:hypothetical protein
MYRSALDILINRHHVNHEFSYRELQLKLRILRDQSNYYILTRLNAKKWQLRTVAETLLEYGTEDSSEIRRQCEAHFADREQELEELESGSESELTPKDLEQDAIHNGNLLPDYQDPEYTELGLRAYSQTVRVAYDLPERLKYNEHAPESRLKMATPDIYTESDLNLIPYASHITYASDLVTNQENVSEYLSDEEEWDFIEGMHHSDYYLLWDHQVPGSD